MQTSARKHGCKACLETHLAQRQVFEIDRPTIRVKARTDKPNQPVTRVTVIIVSGQSQAMTMVVTTRQPSRQTGRHGDRLRQSLYQLPRRCRGFVESECVVTGPVAGATRLLLSVANSFVARRSGAAVSVAVSRGDGVSQRGV